jgi:hypothetical protein
VNDGEEWRTHGGRSTLLHYCAQQPASDEETGKGSYWAWLGLVCPLDARVRCCGSGFWASEHEEEVGGSKAEDGVSMETRGRLFIGVRKSHLL